MIRVRMSAQRLSKPIELSKSCWPWHSGCHTAQILVSLPYKAKRVCNLLFKVFPLSTFENRNFRRSVRLFSICVVSCSTVKFVRSKQTDISFRNSFVSSLVYFKTADLTHRALLLATSNQPACVCVLLISDSYMVRAKRLYKWFYPNFVTLIRGQKYLKLH